MNQNAGDGIIDDVFEGEGQGIVMLLNGEPGVGKTLTAESVILLLDETEVFLEQRTTDCLERNKLVSVSLRILEYYSGVLFLTTNRVTRNLIDMLPLSNIGLDLSDLEVLAEKKMNGREIKNVIKAAQLLASEQNTALGLGHIDTVLRITQIGGDSGAQA
ncbi:hypothetical protein K505DRAFT_349259 [Melanomma pulvis-pyrius CBS 109.77]|uniref:ATPase AAA-type core domain-containing protein n=1 Tax=Melanomma pulvis-pyrius CBS 109.77 TaxID=1314802 RepID=A0A6A6XDF6_9PLEO|nr:hypothetical protein K505DRAFT_349259 [Melanomma pulvis-pyrius CBS 109.77]